ncbi:hypothetical protein [Ramlibacter alkalitolerans]|uniref:Uncharacterized protein n=1 Tax=Ramlibacter alkalitolerans TaxID=2039631 RepID=A0ABS1JVB9_9BURK|nr:hypothetical protein [Ramlibacter alkalitolerans]MBL0427816.1 hypothetical protein [Ramlibacter alkalitolerans]
MDFSDDDKHRATLDMLRESLEYLERLPPVPLTREFCARIRVHLEEPTQRLVSRSQRELHCEAFSPVGRPLVEVSVVDEQLTIQLPASLTKPKDRQAAAVDFARYLMRGPVRLKLKSRNYDGISQ